MCFYNKYFIKHVGQLKNDNFARSNQGLLKVLIPSNRDPTVCFNQ